VLRQDNNSNSNSSNNLKQQHHLVACSVVSEHLQRSNSNPPDHYSAVLPLLSCKLLHLLDNSHNRAQQGRTHISKHFWKEARRDANRQ